MKWLISGTVYCLLKINSCNTQLLLDAEIWHLCSTLCAADM